MTKRKNHKPAFKARVALEAIKGERIAADLASHTVFTRRRYTSGRKPCSTERRRFLNVATSLRRKQIQSKLKTFMPRLASYLHAWSGGREAKAAINKWINFYNLRRPHTVHKGLTPDVAYWTNVPWPRN